jgi:hypothetical protein
MNIRNKVIACIFAVALLSQANVRAEEAIQVTTRVQKQVIVEKDDGTKETRLVAADSVVPGERVVYTISRTLTYVAGSAAGKNLEVEFSVDGGANFAPATELKVADNGVERPATTPDYTHVRWVMRSELAAGGQGQATFAAVLE